VAAQKSTHSLWGISQESDHRHLEQGCCTNTHFKPEPRDAHLDPQLPVAVAGAGAQGAPAKVQLRGLVAAKHALQKGDCGRLQRFNVHQLIRFNIFGEGIGNATSCRCFGTGQYIPYSRGSLAPAERRAQASVWRGSPPLPGRSAMPRRRATPGRRACTVPPPWRTPRLAASRPGRCPVNN